MRIFLSNSGFYIRKLTFEVCEQGSTEKRILTISNGVWDNFNSMFKFGLIEVNSMHLAKGFFSDEVKTLKLTKAPINL
jgi:hypothetical protein